MITLDQLKAERADYQKQLEDTQRLLDAIQGAIQAIDRLIEKCQPQDALTLDQFGQMIGAREVGEPNEVQHEQD